MPRKRLRKLELRLPFGLAELLADRLAAAAAELRLDGEEQDILQRTLFPEEFADRPAGRPTATAAGTMGKVSAMAARAARGEALFHAGDAGGPSGPVGYVLVVQLPVPLTHHRERGRGLPAGDRAAAVGIAKRLLGVRGRSKLPTGCSVEAVELGAL